MALCSREVFSDLSVKIIGLSKSVYVAGNI